MNPWCIDCEVFHPAGGCETIRELRANAVPRVSIDQLQLSPSVLCRACGAGVDDLDQLCPTCEAAVRVAEHTGNINGLTAGQRAAVGITTGRLT